MIVIKIEIWPGGDQKRARTLAIGGIANVGGSKTYGNYTYVLGLKRKTKWRTGTIKHFNRSRFNVWWLLKQILEEI